MIINLKLIKSFKPCKSGLDNYLEHYRKFEGSIEEFSKLEHIPYSDKIWLLKRILPIAISVSWAKACAKSVSHLINRYADAAADAATDAAYADAAAADAAAADAADAAADAAYAAAYAATDAAYAAAYAAYAAAKGRQQELNLKLLVEAYNETTNNSTQS